MNGAAGHPDREAREIAGFDPRSGSFVERLVFDHRAIVLALCALLTLALGWQASHLRQNASFEKTIPTAHPFVVNYLAHRSELTGLGNALRIAVERTDGTIYQAAYLETLRKLSDELFLLPGVDRVSMKSLWTPSTRWVAVTEDGLEGGPVIPDGYDGGQASLERLHRNVDRSGELGQLVALDGRSSVIYVPLLEKDASGKALDYAVLGDRLEALRHKYESASVAIHITGFAKVVGDLIEGLRSILLYFAGAVLIIAAVLYAYTRCVRSTVLVVLCSLIAVVWQLGLLTLFGFDLDPYSVLVPFLVFAIGMSHGAQKMNGIMQDIGRGADRKIAARRTFRRLFLAGLTALVCDAVGFAVLITIRIQAIQDLAIVASIGVAVLIFTNLILLPILLSYVGVGATAARRSLRSETNAARGAGRRDLWHWLGRFTERRWASGVLVAALVLGVVGYATSLRVKIGDLDAGAPELRAESRYNRDNAFMTGHFGAASDVFAVMVSTPDGACAQYQTLMRLDALEWELAQLPGVESTNSVALLNRRVLTGLNEGSPRWYDLLHSQQMLNTITGRAPRGLYNDSCNLLTLYAYLRDHKADTLTGVVEHVQAFAAANDGPDAHFLLAAGNAGIEAATNIVVRKASREMLYQVYGAVMLLCLITFRSWRAVVCAILPLMLTSILCEALMAVLGMGIKVATLPVIALGAGIGVDYALYIMSTTLAGLRRGETLAEAYREALAFTGRVVMLTAATLAASVATWAFSPIKFQADMGILLAFMFVVNMIGALVLLPALASFLIRGPVGRLHVEADRRASTVTPIAGAFPDSFKTTT